MAFEVPLVNPNGDISATVTEIGGVNPTTIIQFNDPWQVTVNWHMLGDNWELLGGTWHVHVNLESIGPGPELSLFDPSVDCFNQSFPSLTGHYTCVFDVPANSVNPPAGLAPHQSLPMKMVVVITAEDLLGNPAPIAAYYEGPILQFYNP
jgi:hypothetical protein